MMAILTAGGCVLLVIGLYFWAKATARKDTLPRNLREWDERRSTINDLEERRRRVRKVEL